MAGSNGKFSSACRKPTGSLGRRASFCSDLACVHHIQPGLPGWASGLVIRGMPIASNPLIGHTTIAGKVADGKEIIYKTLNTESCIIPQLQTSSGHDAGVSLSPGGQKCMFQRLLDLRSLEISSSDPKSGPLSLHGLGCQIPQAPVASSGFKKPPSSSSGWIGVNYPAAQQFALIRVSYNPAGALGVLPRSSAYHFKVSSRDGLYREHPPPVITNQWMAPLAW